MATAIKSSNEQEHLLEDGIQGGKIGTKKKCKFFKGHNLSINETDIR